MCNHKREMNFQLLGWQHFCFLLFAFCFLLCSFASSFACVFCSSAHVSSSAACAVIVVSGSCNSFLFLSRLWHIFNLYSMLQVNLFVVGGGMMLLIHSQYVWVYEWILVFVLVEYFGLTGCFYAHSMQTSSSTELLPFKLNCIAVCCAWCVVGEKGEERKEKGGKIRVEENWVGKVNANSSSRCCFPFIWLEALFLLHVQQKWSKVLCCCSSPNALLLLLLLLYMYSSCFFLLPSTHLHFSLLLVCHAAVVRLSVAFSDDCTHSHTHTQTIFSCGKLSACCHSLLSKCQGMSGVLGPNKHFVDGASYFQLYVAEMTTATARAQITINSALNLDYYVYAQAE